VQSKRSNNIVDNLASCFCQFLQQTWNKFCLSTAYVLFVPRGTFQGGGAFARPPIITASRPHIGLVRGTSTATAHVIIYYRSASSDDQVFVNYISLTCVTVEIENYAYSCRTSSVLFTKVVINECVCYRHAMILGYTFAL